MELRHLRYFVAVGEEQHYNRAAQRLRVAQPALSRQIQDLEEEIGFKLFVHNQRLTKKRSKTAVKPTDSFAFWLLAVLNGSLRLHRGRSNRSRLTPSPL